MTSNFGLRLAIPFSFDSYETLLLGPIESSIKP